MELKKVIGAIVTIMIVATGAVPYAGAEGEGQLEFIDLYPGSLAYDVGEEVDIVCRMINTGTGDIEDATISLTIFDQNGTMVEMDDRDVSGVIEPRMSHRILKIGVWQVDENATSGKYIVEAVLRWGSEAIQETTFFYVPVEVTQTTPGLEITSLYTARLSYKPGDEVDSICKIKNAGTDIKEYYVSLCLFDQNGTLFGSMRSSVNSIDAGKKVKHILKGLNIPMNGESGNYTMESIVWWEDKAVSKTSGFSVSSE